MLPSKDTEECLVIDLLPGSQKFLNKNYKFP